MIEIHSKCNSNSRCISLQVNTLMKPIRYVLRMGFRKNVTLCENGVGRDSFEQYIQFIPLIYSVQLMQASLKINYCRKSETPLYAAPAAF